MRRTSTEWQIYRTRFLIRARQLSGPMFFIDALGREHQGDKGDYLVESSSGTWCIAPRHIFEDIYVAMGDADEPPPLMTPRQPLGEFTRRQAVADPPFLDTERVASS